MLKKLNDMQVYHVAYYGFNTLIIGVFILLIWFTKLHNVWFNLVYIGLFILAIVIQEAIKRLEPKE